MVAINMTTVHHLNYMLSIVIMCLMMEFIWWMWHLTNAYLLICNFALILSLICNRHCQSNCTPMSYAWILFLSYWSNHHDSRKSCDWHWYPLKPYSSQGNILSEALSGSVYHKAYNQLITDPTHYPTLCSHHSMDRFNPCKRECLLFIEAIHVYSSNFNWEILEDYLGMGLSWLYAQEEVIICSEPGSMPGRPKLSCRA
jgi:hypothetical protein